MSAIKIGEILRVMVCGDQGVGKHTLMIDFADKSLFEANYKLTAGADFHIKTIDIQTSEGIKRYKLQLCNVAEKESFSQIRSIWHRRALGELLIFDSTNNESFEHLPNWIEEIRTTTKKEIPILLIGINVI